MSIVIGGLYLRHLTALQGKNQILSSQRLTFEPNSHRVQYLLRNQPNDRPESAPDSRLRPVVIVCTSSFCCRGVPIGDF